MDYKNIIKTPWTDEQVRALNWWQMLSGMHPYTCGNAGRDGYHAHEGVLFADTNGWHCPHCDYTQGWAHEFRGAVPPCPTDEQVAAAAAVNNALG